MSVDLLLSVEFYRGADPPPCQVRTAFDVLSDPAKRKVSRLPPYDRMSSYAKLIPAPHTPLPTPGFSRQAYDNGLNFMRRRVNPDDVQAKLARERAEWQRQAELRHQERMRVLHQEILASQKRYQDTKAQAELRYQEKMKAMEEQLQVNHKAEVAAAEEKPEGAYTLADEMLSDLRRRAPEWEIRKQKVLRVSVLSAVCTTSRR